MENLWMLKNKANNKLVDKIPSWLYLIVCSVGIMVLFYGTQSISSLLLNPILNLIPETSFAYSYVILILSFIGIWMLLFVYRYIFKNSISSIGFTRDRSNKVISNILSALAIGMGISFGSIYICSLVFNIKIGFTPYISDISVYPYVLLSVVAFFIQGGAEELVFRGFLTKWSVKKYNLLVVFLLTSVLFSLMHSVNGVDPLYLTLALCFGFLFFLISVDSNCIYKAMIIHGIYNASDALFKINDDSMTRPYLFYIHDQTGVYNWMGLLSVIAITLVFCLYYVIKLHKKNPKWYFMRSDNGVATYRYNANETKYRLK